MAKPLEVDEQWQERILSQVSGLQYGQVIITVHDGRIVQIDRTERTRYDAASQKNAPSASSPSSQRRKGAGAAASGQQSQKPDADDDDASLRAVK
ncbi:YezD family protein [Paenibacillus sp. CAU 1782]